MTPLDSMRRPAALSRVWALGLLLLGFFYASPALAVRCLTHSGVDQFTESIGSVQTYPENVPDGYIIWISPTRTTTGYCYKDLNVRIVDPIYFYANPAGENPAAWGLEVGIRYNGVDHFGAGNQPGTGVPTGVTVPVCPSADVLAGRCPRIPFSISYQVVIRKKGRWTNMPKDSLAVFQFDGQNGLNAFGTSFRYFVSGLQNLKPSPCVVDVQVTPAPGMVEFGRIATSRIGPGGGTVSRPFSLALHKTGCNTSVNIQGYFDTTHPVQNNLILPAVDSGFGISIERNGKRIALREPFPLAAFTGGDARIDVPLTASLVGIGTPKVGPFTATATIQVLYN